MQKNYKFSSFSVFDVLQNDGCYTSQSRYLFSLGSDKLKSVTGYVANSSPHTKDSQTRHFAIVMKDLKNVTVDGNGSRVLLTDKGSFAYLENCENVTLKNFTFDIETPCCPEFTVMKTGLTSANVQFAPNTRVEKIDDSTFDIKCGNTKIAVDGKGITYMRALDADRNAVFTIGKDPADIFSKVTKLDILSDDGVNQTVKLSFKSLCPLKNGYSYSYRTNIRDEAGFVFDNCKNVTLDSCNVKYMHTQGIVAQFCENVTIEKLDVRPKTSQSVACTGNVFDFFECSGTVSVKNSYFCGCLGKIVNMGAQYARINGRLDDHTLACAYANAKYYGIPFCKRGDVLAVTETESLTAYSRYKALKCAVDKINPDLFNVTFEGEVPQDAVGKVLENESANGADLIFENNTLYDVPNKAVCINSAGNHTLRFNNFKKVTKSAIYIGGDAKTDFVAGRVGNITIAENRFSDCNSPIICVDPTVPESVCDFAESVSISDNYFTESEKTLYDIKHTREVEFDSKNVCDDEKYVGSTAFCLSSKIKDYEIRY